eukprot:SAG31_NODE_5422_length_2547_cov_2.691585_1_plen_95_part_00
MTMTLAGAVPHAAAVVLLLATVCRLPRAVALSPEEAAGLQGLCDLNPSIKEHYSAEFCGKLDNGQDPCECVLPNECSASFSRVICTADGHLFMM